MESINPTITDSNRYFKLNHFKRYRFEINISRAIVIIQFQIYTEETVICYIVI